MRRLTGLLVAWISVALSAQQQTPPVFRARVDLVSVDVAVVNRDGKPVTGLAPSDFQVVAGNRPRRVVAADWVTVAATRSKPAADARPPAPSTNSLPTTGRSFLFVIDIGHIAAGDGHTELKSIAAYLDRLDPADRVGLVALPHGTPRVDLTTNRQLVKDAAGRIVGASLRNQGGMMTVGEAAAVEIMDSRALDNYLERIQTPDCGVSAALLDPQVVAAIDKQATSCLMRMMPVAVQVMDEERQRTRDLLDSLEALAGVMTSIDGPKSIVLVSEGLVIDRQTIADLRRFADAAERARVTFYALNLAPPLSGGGTRYNMTSARTLDQRTLLDGMSMVAVAGRGDAFMTSGRPSGALERIDAETSGYYLVSFERDGQDRPGERQGIDVRVNWPGATVRARKDFTINQAEPAIAPSADLRAAIGRLLRWPVATIELGLDLDTYVVPVLTGRDDARAVIAASFASAGQPMAAVGYEVTNAEGQVMADGFEVEKLVTERLNGDRQLYLAAIGLPAGTYRVKLAGISAEGRRGSIEHEFSVAPSRAGALRMSDVFLGEISSKGFLPSPWLLPGTAALPVSVEVYADTLESLSDAVVTLELGRVAAPPLARLTLTQKESNDPRRRVASATLAIASLPAGDYVVTAELLSASGGTVRRSRQFTKR